MPIEKQKEVDNMRIIVDGHGGDHAPLEILKGCEKAVAEMGMEIVVCGQELALKAIMEENHIDGKNISFVEAPEVIDFEEDPVAAIRTKKNSSMVVGLTMLSNGEGDAFVSAGATGALLIGATLIVKRIKGIKRAALAPILPTKRGRSLLIDAGANSESTAEHVMQFAMMGSIYMETVLNIEKPTVGLVNMGTEETKGGPLQHEAFELLSKSGLNFYGNIEGRDAAMGTVDVIACDGFTGNVLLKTFEGMGMHLAQMVKELFMRDAKSKFAAFLVKKGIKEFKQKIDFKEEGGALFLGINGPVIKAHGSSDARAFCGALRQAYKSVSGNMVEKIRQRIEEDQSTAQQ